MKKLFLLFALAAFFVGCGTSTPKQQEAQEEVVLEQVAEEIDSIAGEIDEAAAELEQSIEEVQ